MFLNIFTILKKGEHLWKVMNILIDLRRAGTAMVKKVYASLQSGRRLVIREMFEEL
jgi:hypothetical protein